MYTGLAFIEAEFEAFRCMRYTFVRSTPRTIATRWYMGSVLALLISELYFGQDVYFGMDGKWCIAGMGDSHSWLRLSAPMHCTGVLDALIQTTTYILFPAFAVGSDYAERLDFSLSVRSEIFFPRQ